MSAARYPLFEKGRDGGFFIGPLYFTSTALVMTWVIATLVLVIMGTCPPLFAWSTVPLMIGLTSLVIGGLVLGIYGIVRGLRTWVRNSEREREHLSRSPLYGYDDEEDDYDA